MHNFKTKLAQLEAQNRLRSLRLPCGIDLTSNDYLGFANHPKLKEAALTFLQKETGVGAGGSRLLRGHTAAHQALEDFAAYFFAAPKTLYFSSGFQANSAIFQALPSRHDTIIFDELVHASAREAIQNSHARRIKAEHNDLVSFENALKEAKASERAQIWIAVESIYSMDGDAAPLKELYDLAEIYDAILIVDEAHGSGVCGPTGRGLSEELIAENGYERIVTLHTCGKAIGVAGGLLCAEAEIVDMLVNSARAFIYSTAPMPLQAFLVQKSLELVDSIEGHEARVKLQSLNKKAQSLFDGAGTHIVPIIIGDDETCVNVAEHLQKDGFDIRAIRPPTVPEGSARLRLSLSAALDAGTLDDFAQSYFDIQKKRAA